jgi:predicted NBD/HSP70 family sugar kinase
MLHLKGENMVDLRKNNRAKMLGILLKYGPISRAEISEISGLTPPTITAMANELLEEGLLEEAGIDNTKQEVGRKRIKMQLVDNARLALGVEIGVKNLLVGLANLSGQLLYKYSAPLAGKDPEAVIEQTVQVIQDIIAKFPNEKIIGLGVGATGRVDHETGTVKHSPNLGWKDVPLRKRLEQVLAKPVVVDNNVRLMALGENMFFHNWGDISRLILIHVGYGIGCGIILDGNLYYGHAYGAGELGHTIVLPNGPACSCGKLGCLETLASGRAMTALYQEKTGKDLGDYQQELEKMLAAAVRGEQPAVGIMKEAGMYLGIGVVNLLNLLAPDLIMLHGSLFESEIYTQELISQINAGGFNDQEGIPIKHSQAKDELVILGAGALAFQKVLVFGETVSRQ